MEIFFEITYKDLSFGYLWNPSNRGLTLSKWPDGSKSVRLVQGICITQNDAEKLALRCTKNMFNDPVSFQLPKSVCDEWGI